MFGKSKKSNSEQAKGIGFSDYCAQHNEMFNFIISGGSSEERTRAIYTLIYKARQLNMPTIVLHSNNDYLKAAPLSYIWGNQAYLYEPAKGKTATEIADLLTDVGVNMLGADRKIFSLILLIAKISTCTNEEFTLERIISFPCDRVMDKLEEMNREGKINDIQRKDFAKEYGGSAGDCVAEVSRLFSRLKNSWGNSDNGSTGHSLLETIKSGGIITFNLITDTNPVLKELCFADINVLMQHGERFLLIIDGLSILGKDESHTDTVIMKTNGNISLLFSAADVPQMMLQRDEFFHTLVGGHANLLLFQHTNGKSAQKWSDFFGQEWISIVERTGGKTSANWRLFDSSTNEGYTVRKQRMDRFPQEVFQTIPFGQGKGYLVDFTGVIPQQIVKVKMPMLDNGVVLCLR